MSETEDLLDDLQRIQLLTAATSRAVIRGADPDLPAYRARVMQLIERHLIRERDTLPAPKPADEDK